MSKIKKVLAVLLTLAMVLGMSMTTMAADLGKATITVKNAGSAKFACEQIIAANPETKTGWEIVKYNDSFHLGNAFGQMDDQDIIAGMIYSVNKDADKGKEILGFDSKYATVLEDIFGKVGVGTLSAPLEVDSAGVWFIKGDEANYNFNPMAAYVSFDEYDTENGAPTVLKGTEVEAKKEPNTLEKFADEEDENKKVVEIGRVVTFHVKPAQVPFVPLTDQNRQYWVTDEITKGATYVTNTEGKIKLTVTIGTNEPQTFYGTVVGNKFTANLSSLLTNNQYSGQQIDITYDVTITDVQIQNDVMMGDAANNNRYGHDSENLYTGEIELYKYATDKTPETLEDNVKLDGAKFIVYKFVNDTKTYAQFDKNNKFVAWGEEEDATKLETANGGHIKVEGLDLGTYFFKEVKAPEGYSITEKDESVELTVEGNEASTTVTANPANVLNTKLSSLPSTGGIGTTIFTIGGCIIMIAAAALFFASRKKSEK